MIPLQRKLNILPPAFFFAALFLQSLSAGAQSSNDKEIIHAGDSLNRYYSYLFPSFRDAVVKMRDGRVVNYRMNFNLLICDMQFINSSRDTVVITNPSDVDSIRLDSCLFIYDHNKGYIQILASSDAASLAIHRHTSFQPMPKGAYGSNNSAGGEDMINSITTRGGTRPLVLNEDIYVLKNTTYVLYYKDQDMEVAKKAEFMKLYNGDKKDLDEFIKENRIDFKKQGDLEKLFHFCTQSKM